MFNFKSLLFLLSLLMCINGSMLYGDKSDNKLWYVGDKVIEPKCLSYIWRSNDNYTDFVKFFKIPEPNDFITFPGKYFGKEIIYYEPIPSSWNKQEEVGFSYRLSSCLSYPNLLKNIKYDESAYFSPDYENYTVLRNIDKKICQKLAPNIHDKCIDAKLVKKIWGPGGSMGEDIEYNVYGIFETHGNRYIIPLIFEYDKKKVLRIINKL